MLLRRHKRRVAKARDIMPAPAPEPRKRKATAKKKAVDTCG